MTNQLIYLPDPTIKFFIEFKNDAVNNDTIYFTENEIEARKKESPTSKIVPLIVKDREILLNELKIRFDNKRFVKPYFNSCLDKIELFEVMDI